MMDFFHDYLEIILLVMILSMLLIVSLLIIIFIQFSSLKQKYNKLMNGTGVDNLDGVITHIHEEIKSIKSEQSDHTKQIDELQKLSKKMKARIGFLRYNAFEQSGNELSFSLAIVDEEANGVVLTGLHSREQTYVYAKPINQGNSKYPLTEEEKAAIHQAAKME